MAKQCDSIEFKKDYKQFRQAIEKLKNIDHLVYKIKIEAIFIVCWVIAILSATVGAYKYRQDLEMNNGTSL